MSSLQVAFIVQGEGRGHMTQALALAAYLRDAGHEVARVLLGRSPFRPVPDYFTREIDAPLETFAAPTQVPGRASRGASVAATVLDAARRLPAFVASGFRIHELTRHADVVINFLDLVGGLSRIVLRSRVPAIAVAHNYVFFHPALAAAAGRPRAGRLVGAYARGTTGGATERVALSFDALEGEGANRLVVAPPLLRAGLRDMSPRDDGYLLAYALNPGYANVLADWQRGRKDVAVHCYVEGGRAALDAEPEAGFQAHELDDRGFLAHLEGCRAYVGSAGFEAICEAHHLGKPVLAVPTDGQPEQTLNAWDAERAGAARAGSYGDVDSFWSDPPAPSRDTVSAFRRWVARSPEIMVERVERAARGRRGAGVGPP